MQQLGLGRREICRLSLGEEGLMPITGAYERATASRGAEEPTRLKTVLDRGRDSPSQGKGRVEQLLIFGMTKYRKGTTNDLQRSIMG